MNRMLFLRGKVPTDRDPREILYDNLEECSDVWTHLAYQLGKRIGYANIEVWYWGGIRNHVPVSGFRELYIPNFSKASLLKDEFDLIFARGGFKEYEHVLKMNPKAFKIYYGAGRRFLPTGDFTDYNLILVDTVEQYAACKRKFPNIHCEILIKPAADNIFRPIEILDKQYDVCFPANGSQANIKGHNFVFSTAPKDLKILNIGNFASNIRYPKNVERVRVDKREMPYWYSMCKVGIVCCSGDVDSCPRVIPEMLACGLPLITLDNVRFWGKCTSGPWGHSVNKERFWDVVKETITNLWYWEARSFYLTHLSLPIAVETLTKTILRLNK